MLAYIYRADVYCAECGQYLRRMVANENPCNVPQNTNNESSYDSDRYPKGPIPDGGGEADTPQLCGRCGVFLENPLTADGIRYVQAKLGENPPSPTVEEWAEFYGIK